MIQYLRRKQIDIDKYDNCIQNASNSRIYALSYYLDIVADNWDALVLNDYEAVMPLPWRSKYFIKYIYTPCWTQQLGVFSIPKLSTELVDQFIKAIPKKFLKTSIYFNSESQPSSFVQKRDNYILDLNDSYSDICKNFNKNRKRIIVKLNTLEHTLIKNDSLDNFSSTLKKKDSGLFINNTDKKILFRLISKSIKLNKGQVISVILDNSIEASFFITFHKKIITNLIPISTKKGKEKNLPTLVINHIIKTNQQTDKILDFEGSMIPGVAQFYKSFGSTLENYFQFTKRF